MTCEILQVIFWWLCQSTVNVSNWEARPIHKIKQELGGNAKPQEIEQQLGGCANPQKCK